MEVGKLECAYKSPRDLIKMNFLIQLIWNEVQDSEYLTIFWGNADVANLGSTFV